MCSTRLFLLLLTGLVPGLFGAPIERWSNAEGDLFSREGAFYSFMSADGLRGIRLWTPPGDGPLHAILLHGNPGGGFGGDTRSKTRQRDLLEFAARHRLAVAGVTGFPGRETHDRLAPVVIRALAGFAALGRHPELAHAPWIATGGSNAGAFAWGMLVHAPGRTLAITPNVGPVYSGEPSDEARLVPAWMHIGVLDPLMPFGVPDTEALFRRHGTSPLAWAWDAEMKGHENGSSDAVDMAYWEAVLALRLPRESGGALQSVDLRRGWFVDHATWDYPIVRVAPAATIENPQAEPGRYGWMPDEGSARLYQAVATRARVLRLTVEHPSAGRGGARSGVYLSSGANAIVSPGETIRVRLDLDPLVWDLGTVTLFDRAEPVGRFPGQDGATFEFQASGERTLYALHARAEGRRGAERVSNPVLVVVRHPETSAAIDGQFAEVSLEARAARGEGLLHDAEDLLRSTEDVPGTIVARPLHGVVGGTDPDGKADARWAGVTSVRLDDRHAVGIGDTRGTAMDVAVVYDDRGLHFRFEIVGEDWSRASVGDLDRNVDFHLASQSVGAIRAAGLGPQTWAFVPVSATLRRAIQFQVALNGEAGGVRPVRINEWSSWDCVRHVLDARGSVSPTGLSADVVINEDRSRVLELFLPWSLCGNPGLAKRPPPGSRFAIVFGYHGAASATKLVWPAALDPWGVPSTDPKASKVWGELVLGD